MSNYQRYWAAMVAAAICAPMAQQAAADFDTDLIVKGELVVDLRVADLEGNTATWMNRDTAGDTMGDFNTLGGGNLNTAAFVAGGGITVPFALDVAQSSLNPLRAANQVPTSLQGASTRSVEAWIFARNGGPNQAVVSWGSGGNNNDSSFNWSNNSNSGMFNGWNNDSPWGNPVITGEWVHVAWVYDGSAVRGYRNGVLDNTHTASALTTPESFMTVGSVRGGGGDPFTGLIADVRVHTGVLTQSEIQDNYSLGIAPLISTPGDFDGDGDLDSADLGILRGNLFTSGSSSDGDYNRDGYIDWDDWRLFKDNPARQVGFFSPAAPLIANVPEPGSLTCLTLAAFSLIGASTRGRRCAAR